MTFMELVEKWEAFANATKGTKRQHREHFEIRCKQIIDMPISKITRQVITNWYTDLSKDSASTSTKNKTITYVKGALKFAEEEYNHPAVCSHIKKFKKTDKEVMAKKDAEIVWDIDEFNSFLECVNSELYRIYFSTLYWTGARRGEIIALQCSDLKVDRDGNKYIYIHANQRDASEGLKPTKTRETRYVELDDKTYAQLKKLQETYRKGYLFGGESALAPTTISRFYNNAIKKSGVKKIKLHGLRHSHVTFLINHGVNPEAVSKRIGHSSVRTTLEVYSHLFKSTNQSMMDLINETRTK